MANESGDNGDVRINDFFYVVDPFPVVTPEASHYDSITGVLRWANGHSKIEPRDADDIIDGPPALVEITPASAFLAAGTTGATEPPMEVVMTREVESATEIALTYGAATILSGPSSVTIPAGSSSVVLQLIGGTENTTLASVTATYEGISKSADVRVFGAAEAREIGALTPATQDVRVNETATLTVELTLPAGTGGQVVDVTLSSGLSGAATVTVPEGLFSVEFELTVGGVASSESVEVAIGASSATAAVEVSEAPAERDVSGWVLEQTTGDLTFTLPSGTAVAEGSFIIIGRNSTQAAFETFWGVTLGEEVVFLNSGDSMPQINGDETYTLSDGSGTVLDGPTIALEKYASYQRSSEGAANVAASWATFGNGPGDTTPGTAGISPASGGWITEFADAEEYIYEFVEIYVGAP